MSESAFGVEHIQKSMLPGGTFKPISRMTGKERKVVRTAKDRYKSKGPTEEHQAFKGTYKVMREHAATNPRGIRRDSSMPEKTIAAGTLKFGGKSSKETWVGGAHNTDAKTVRTVAAHEQNHVKPKRSAYRLHGQIMGDPKKLLREEARADYKSGGHFDNPEAVTQYAVSARGQKAADRIPFMPSNGKKHWGPADQNNFDDLGVNPRQFTRRKASQMNIAAVNGQFPHYPQGKKAEQGFREYRKLQDNMRAKGVKSDAGPQIKSNADRNKDIAIGTGALGAGGAGAYAINRRDKKNSVNKSAFGVEHISKDYTEPVGFKYAPGMTQARAKKKVRRESAVAGLAGGAAGFLGGSVAGKTANKGRNALIGAGIGAGLGLASSGGKAKRAALTKPTKQPVYDGDKGLKVGYEQNKAPAGMKYERLSIHGPKHGNKGVTVMAKSAFGIEHE